MSNPVEMNRADFVEWAVKTFGVDEDTVSFWDMARDLNSTKPMPEGFEVSNVGEIPAVLYDVLQSRKAARTAPVRTPFVPTPDRWDFDGE